MRTIESILDTEDKPTFPLSSVRQDYLDRYLFKENPPQVFKKSKPI